MIVEGEAPAASSAAVTRVELIEYLHHRQKGRAVQTNWLHIVPSDPATIPAAVVTTDDGLQVTAETCQLAEQRGVMLQVGIDGRWSHARSLTVRARPEPLHVVALERDTP